MGVLLRSKRGSKFSHLVSDASLEELHAFARAAGLSERAFDRDHYDVPAHRRAELVARGAVPVTGRELVRRLLPETIGIFILPPSLTALEARLNGRGKDSAEVIARRLAAAKEEISHVDEFDYVIINDHFEEALRDLVSVVRAERLRLGKQSTLHEAMIAAMKG